MTIEVEARPLQRHTAEVKALLENRWGSANIVSRGKLTDASAIPRIIARDGGQIIGLLTYMVDQANKTCEIVSLDAIRQRQGIGRELIRTAEEQAKAAGCRRIWLVTTNTNPEAAIFYVKQGYRLVAVHLDALEASRRLKPQIPAQDERGIPLTDEWEFSKSL